MMIFLSLTRINMKKALSAKELENILNGIANGVVKLKKRDGKLTIVYANEGFYNMQGYTKREYKEKFHKDAFALVNEKDLRIIEERLEKLQNKECVSIEYRIVTSFEKQRWILLNVEMLLRNNEPVYMCTFTDITKHKRVESDLLLGNERLSLILEKIDNLIIEYDLKEDYVHYFTDSRINMRCLNDALTNGYVDEADFERLQQVIENCKNRRINQSIALKINIDGKSKWYELRVTTLFDINDEPVKAIARVSDIDFAYREKVALIDMSQKEAMTGLYNKPFAEELIQEYMENDADNAALLVIDIDNFKNINDTLGHAYGDAAIKYVASELQSLFRSDDVVARMGGDEFLVYMRNIKSVESVKTRLSAIYEAFSRYQFSGSDMKLSCSIGVVIYEKDETPLKELIDNADQAMYYCKRNGKNNYHFYDKNEQVEEMEIKQDEEKQEAE